MGGGGNANQARPEDPPWSMARCARDPSVPPKMPLLNRHNVRPAQRKIMQIPVAEVVKFGHRPSVFAPGSPGVTQATQQPTLLKQPPQQARLEFSVEVRERRRLAG